jgi:hypothetical protein
MQILSHRRFLALAGSMLLGFLFFSCAGGPKAAPDQEDERGISVDSPDYVALPEKTGEDAAPVETIPEAPLPEEVPSEAFPLPEFFPEEPPPEEVPPEKMPPETLPLPEFPPEEPPPEEVPPKKMPPETLPLPEFPPERTPLEEISPEKVPPETLPLPEFPLEKMPAESIPIIGEGVTGQTDLSAFLLSNNPGADPVFTEELAALYLEESAIEGINHDIAFVQMCLETGFLRYGGLVKPEMNNFCGLGSLSADNPGESFPSPQIGVRAHIQHLKAYASEKGLNQELVDPRYRWVRYGSAPTVEKLTGAWAADREYGTKIRDILERLYRFTKTE